MSDGGTSQRGPVQRRWLERKETRFRDRSEAAGSPRRDVLCFRGWGDARASRTNGRKSEACADITTILDRQRQRIRTKRTATSVGCLLDILLSPSYYPESLPTTPQRNPTAQAFHISTDLHARDLARTEIIDISRGSSAAFYFGQAGSYKKQRIERKRWRPSFFAKLTRPGNSTNGSSGDTSPRQSHSRTPSVQKKPPPRRFWLPPLSIHRHRQAEEPTTTPSDGGSSLNVTVIPPSPSISLLPSSRRKVPRQIQGQRTTSIATPPRPHSHPHPEQTAN
jgi:hypothetical protein